MVELARGVADSFDAVVAAVDVISVVASVVTTSVLGAVITVLVSTSSALTALAKMAVGDKQTRILFSVCFTLNIPLNVFRLALEEALK